MQIGPKFVKDNNKPRYVLDGSTELGLKVCSLTDDLQSKTHHRKICLTVSYSSTAEKLIAFFDKIFASTGSCFFN